jgi:hypothetical protein
MRLTLHLKAFHMTGIAFNLILIRTSISRDQQFTEFGNSGRNLTTIAFQPGYVDVQSTTLGSIGVNSEKPSTAWAKELTTKPE